MTICLATNNPNKIREMNDIIPKEIKILSLEEIGCYQELEENRDTIEGNSLQKAKYVFDHYHIACISDDTGLEVKALNGAPGVFSARYAGEERNSKANIALLLQNLQNLSDRSARFKTVITFIENSDVHQFEGIVEGTIIDEIRGNNGFGYDPVFVPNGKKITFAEMDENEKNRISHRGKAVQKLLTHIKENH
jgi:XTP/dITP diphosphohydrolase